MKLNSFYQNLEKNAAVDEMPNQFSVTPQQGSRFAKEIAQDFNPLHDPESKRFCVPGDLLFCLVLSRLGLPQKMEVSYQGMVSGNKSLKILNAAEAFAVEDQEGKTYLSGVAEGETLQNHEVINGFCKAYVAFSGMSFPHLLVPLMQEKGVMINPQRPMVIYEKMGFEFERPIINLNQVPSLHFSEAEFDVQGKRGKIQIRFDIYIEDRVIGKGSKTMTLSGLKAFDEEAMDALVKDYEASKTNYVTVSA